MFKFHIKLSSNIFFIGCLLLYLLLNNLSGKSQTLIKDDNFSKSSLLIQDFQINYLAELCRFWGVMKYNHPYIIKGKVNWDQELIKLIPKVLRIQDDIEFNILIDSLLGTSNYKLKSKSSDNNIVKESSFYLWQNSKIVLNEDNQKKLDVIKNISKHKSSYYLKQYSNGIVEAINERYFYLDTLNENYRLLGLFRFWNLIEYYYPYKQMIKPQWDSVLYEFIPKAYNSKEILTYQYLFMEIASKLYDGHAVFYSSKLNDSFGYYFLPFYCKFINNLTIVASYANDSLGPLSNLRLGDIILNINKNDIDTIRKSINKYAIGATLESRQRFINDWLLRMRDSISFLKIERNDSILYLKVNTFYWNNIYKNTCKKGWFIIDDSIVYINGGYVMSKDKRLLKIMKSSKGVIIDMRYYPSDGIYWINKYLPFNSVWETYMIIKDPDLKKLNSFKTTKYSLFSAYPFNIKKKILSKYVVLINEGTQSAGETICLQYKKVKNLTFIGSNTAGTNGSMVRIYLPGYLIGNYSCQGVYYPDDRCLQGYGIHPDIFYTPTIKGTKEGKDEVLERAIQYINTGK